MCEIECAQLHSELFRRRHSTRQSHGVFALAKHLLSTYLAGQCHKHLMVSLNVYRTTIDGVEICIRQLGRVEDIWLPYDAGLSAA